MAQQTACDSLYIKVAGMPATQQGTKNFTLKKDLAVQLKRLYVSNPDYSITGFVFAHSSMCGGGINNTGPDFNPYVLRYIQNAKSGTHFYFDAIAITGPKGKCEKQFYLEVK
jgi:hypothetical protein